MKYFYYNNCYYRIDVTASTLNHIALFQMSQHNNATLNSHKQNMMKLGHHPYLEMQAKTTITLFFPNRSAGLHKAHSIATPHHTRQLDIRRPFGGCSAKPLHIPNNRAFVSPLRDASVHKEANKFRRGGPNSAGIFQRARPHGGH